MFQVCNIGFACRWLQKRMFLDKSTPFQEFDASDELFVSAKQVDELVKDETEVFMIFK